MMNRLKALICGAILACTGAGAATAQELTMAVWGGGGANTWREAFIKQFAPGNGSTIKMVEVPNPAGALRSPAAANQYNLALVTYFEAIALSNAGLIESFDDKQLPGIADVDPTVRAVAVQVIASTAFALVSPLATVASAASSARLSAVARCRDAGSR